MTTSPEQRFADYMRTYLFIHAQGRPVRDAGDTFDVLAVSQVRTLLSDSWISDAEFREQVRHVLAAAEQVRAAELREVP